MVVILLVVVVVLLVIGLALVGRQNRMLAELTAMVQQHVIPDELGEQKSELTNQNRLYRDFLAEDAARAKLPPKERFAAFATWKQSQAS
ncbi:MAG: hypothetical protein HKN82_09005 [Akkermansiaceae bacterium]|nr:hypothetical protein [Akkermansiaceae bacterium]NNM29001.1 hypothetical protein [Akkermansiaceae bacterium]